MSRSRFADTQPFWGGAALAISQTDHGLDCTSAMTVLKNVLVTAGHCYNVGQDVYTPAGALVGRVVQRQCGGASGNDMETIENRGYDPFIYLKTINSSTGGPVTNAGTPALGVAQYRYSGARTGEHFGYEVTNDDWWIAVPDSPCGPNNTHLLYIRRSLNGAWYCDADYGDSGAPFYYRDAFNNVMIRGMIIARRDDRQACFAEPWSRIRTQLNVAIKTT
jgi:hypothetical protein